MADEDQWVAVFADVMGNNLDEFVRCTCIEGPEQFMQSLEAQDRPQKNTEHLHSLQIDGLQRRAYLVSEELFEIAAEHYRKYLEECIETQSLPPYFEKNLLSGAGAAAAAANLMERELVFRATMSDFIRMEEEAAERASTHGRIALDEFEIGHLREILSRAYERDSLVFVLEQGECVLRNCTFKPFEVAFHKNEQFRARVRKFVLWAVLSDSTPRLWTQYSREGGVYVTTVELLYKVGKEHPDHFTEDLRCQFVEGVDVGDGLRVRVAMTLEEMLGKNVDKTNVVVPRSVVEYVLCKRAEPPFFLPKLDETTIEEQNPSLQ